MLIILIAIVIMTTIQYNNVNFEYEKQKELIKERNVLPSYYLTLSLVQPTFFFYQQCVEMIRTLCLPCLSKSNLKKKKHYCY